MIEVSVAPNTRSLFDLQQARSLLDLQQCCVIKGHAGAGQVGIAGVGHGGRRPTVAGREFAQ
jgi:hypothetical protein